MHASRISSLSRVIGALLLAMAMLLAQLAGQQHRIEHAAWSGSGEAPQWSQIAPDGNPLKTHSCLVFDAVTLADILGTALVVVAALAGRHILNRRVPVASRFASFVPLFLSRAPPGALSLV